jgi:hypothetical protein
MASDRVPALRSPIAVLEAQELFPSKRVEFGQNIGLPHPDLSAEHVGGDARVGSDDGQDANGQVSHDRPGSHQRQTPA